MRNISKELTIRRNALVKSKMNLLVMKVVSTVTFSVNLTFKGDLYSARGVRLQSTLQS